MPRTAAAARSTAEFKLAVPVKVTRPRFTLSSSLAHIDATRIASKASIEIEVGRFTGNGCGSTVTAVVKRGKVTVLKVTPCAESKSMRMDATLKAVLSGVRKQLGDRPTPPKFRPMPFATFQKNARAITVTTITCSQICILGHCIVCCSLPQGGYYCGSRIIIHTP